jgi:hypothetical protein
LLVFFSVLFFCVRSFVLGLFGLDYNPGGETQEAKKIASKASLLGDLSSMQLLYSADV